MFGNTKFKFLVKILYVAAAIAGAGIVAFGAGFEPGSEDDPVVTKSYVDNQIEDWGINIETKISDIYSKISSTDNSPESASAQDLQIVEVEAGESAVFGSGTQVILRGGTGSIIDSPQGGIVDLTQGVDLRSGYDVPANHLLMVPRDDGRGIMAVTKCILMVTGEYEIK